MEIKNWYPGIFPGHDSSYSELSGKQKVATVLNWLGTAAYQLHDEFNYTGKDKCNEIYQHTTLNNNLRFKLYIQEQL